MVHFAAEPCARPFRNLPVDPFITVAVVLLAVWATGTWYDAPGWIHLLLTAGVFLLLWRIVSRNRPGGEGTR